jgi:RNA polymerase sigma factor for flagellar operon FliA
MMMSGKYPEQSPNPQDLVETHIGLVRRLAHYFHSRVRGVVEVEDLIQIGCVGLVDAAQRYVKKDGVSFTNYASIRIRGAIVDHLRRSSNLCRTTISMQQKVKQATSLLQKRLHRLPEDAEVAKELGLSIAEYDRWQHAFQANRHQSLDEVHDDYGHLFVSKTATPEEEMNKVELRAALRASLEDLSEREALVVQLYFVEELNVYEIAEILDVTTGRVSQIKKAALLNLRSGLARRTGDDGDVIAEFE